MQEKEDEVAKEGKLEISETDPPSEGAAPDRSDTDASPPKKKSKRQKKAEAAAKRAAAAAQVEEEPNVPAVSTETEPTTSTSTDMVKQTSATKATKHKRDDEDDDNLVTMDVSAKKVKADTGEVVKLESVENKVDEPSSKAMEKASSVAPSDVRSTTAPPPSSNRENSRLRIYFASPVASASSHPAPAPDTRAESVKDATPAPTADASAPHVSSSPISVKNEDAETASENADGDDVDGEPVLTVSGPLEAAETVVSLEDSSEDDEEEVQSVLVEADLTAAQPAPIDAGTSSMLSTDVSNPAPSVAASDAPTDDQSISHVPHVLPPEPSPDRISISFARNTRRMVIDAGVVDKVTIHRGEGRIEITVMIKPAVIGEGDDAVVDEFRICRGVLVSCALTKLSCR